MFASISIKKLEFIIDTVNSENCMVSNDSVVDWWLINL
jgi:hypothetical protein